MSRSVYGRSVTIGKRVTVTSPRTQTQGARLTSAPGAGVARRGPATGAGPRGRVRRPWAGLRGSPPARAAAPAPGEAEVALAAAEQAEEAARRTHHAAVAALNDFDREHLEITDNAQEHEAPTPEKTDGPLDR